MYYQIEVKENYFVDMFWLLYFIWKSNLQTHLQNSDIKVLNVPWLPQMKI